MVAQRSSLKLTMRKNVAVIACLQAVGQRKDQRCSPEGERTLEQPHPAHALALVAGGEDHVVDQREIDRLARAAEAIDLTLVDHMVFAARNQCQSMRRMGLL